MRDSQRYACRGRRKRWHARNQLLTRAKSFLNFAGNCREAFDFYRSDFGGEFTAIQTFGEAPAEAGMPEALRDQIMHVSLPVAGAVLMGNDVPDASRLIARNNFSISLAPETRAACDALFTSLSAGGEVEMPMQETFWGAYYGSCRDRFGISWMLNHELAPASA